LSTNEIIKLFEKETKKPFYSTFSQILPSLTIDGQYISHSVIFKNGRSGVLTYIPPHLQRMRSFDLFPLKIANWILTPFGYDVFRGLYRRFDYNLQKELISRQMLLDSGFSWFEIPRPIPSASSKHILVCEGELFTESSSNSENNQNSDYQRQVLSPWNVTKEFSRFLNRGILLPDISTSNQCYYGNKIGLKRYGTAFRFDQNELTNSVRMLKILSQYKEKPINFNELMPYAQALKIDQKAVIEATQGQFTSMGKQYFKEHNDLVIGLAEGCLAAESMRKSQNSSPIVHIPLFFELLSRLPRLNFLGWFNGIL